MVLSLRSKRSIFIIIGMLCLTPWVGPPLALLMGIAIAVSLGSIFDTNLSNTITNWLLKASVVGLGFDMNFNTAIRAGKDGFVFTVISITATLILGYYLGKKLKVDYKTTALISSGTAICGGSTIAAIAPIIDADDKQISIAMGTVFILNSVALFLFPIIGHLMHLTQVQFGYWSAIAIHDTSSVVGAASTYGSEALDLATSVKLGRALWILPLSFVGSYIYRSGRNNVTIPYFIFLFVGAMFLNTYVPSISVLSGWIVPIAKQMLTLTLFLIGTGLSLRVLKKVGVRPLLKGGLLWILISISSLWMVLSMHV